tara:strand:- start:472 stop:612 length:141 start_codon:yes stop_codon:yes gene_type:complete
MTKLDAMHIQFLQEMTSHKNEEWAAEAFSEIKELKLEYAKKGIIVV